MRLPFRRILGTALAGATAAVSLGMTSAKAAETPKAPARSATPVEKCMMEAMRSFDPQFSQSSSPNYDFVSDNEKYIQTADQVSSPAGPSTTVRMIVGEKSGRIAELIVGNEHDALHNRYSAHLRSDATKWAEDDPYVSSGIPDPEVKNRIDAIADKATDTFAGCLQKNGIKTNVRPKPGGFTP